MESCFILIRCDKQMRGAVVAQLRQLSNIEDIEELDDEQELRVKVVAKSKDHLREIAAMKIQKMTCVQSTRT
ncbi:MAG: hypothetical protein ACE5GR_02350 [Nitrosopumilus sp.]